MSSPPRTRPPDAAIRERSPRVIVFLDRELLYGPMRPRGRTGVDDLAGVMGGNLVRQRASTNVSTSAATDVENVMLKPRPRAFGETW